MKTIVITRPDFFDGETALTNRLFRLGMQRLHLRKPRATEQQMAEWIAQIEPQYRHLIVLHDHHTLLPELGLGGIHLNSRNPAPPSAWPDLLFTISRSCHSIEEIERYKAECDYLFLSPIYDSISKEGYGAAFSRQEIARAHQQGIIDDKVYALGGVSTDHLPEIQSMGFGGAAILGDLWFSDSPEERLQMFLHE